MINGLAQQLLEQYQCIPVAQSETGILIQSSKKLDSPQCEEIRFLFDVPVTFQTVTETEFKKIVSAQFEPSELDPQKQKTIAISFVNDDTIQFVNEIIHKAIDDKASDIHFEPYEHYLRVRFRIDGALLEIQKLDNTQKKSIIARLKIMAELDIAEKRRPQDGRIRLEKHDHNIDIRVSTLPTDYGEKVVLRILDKSVARFDLASIGFDQTEFEKVSRAIQSPFGIILVTGPTGSGKSTTLYSILKQLNTPDTNIVTIEDPIEYNIAGINQSHARPDIGYTFASALKSFLRQDPDVIMVGEIRDSDTAEMAVRASLTGHLVLSTLHTNDAPGTISRLIDMGVEPFLISGSTKLVIAQRLIRVLCDQCKRKEKYTLNQLKEFSHLSFHHVPMGCSTCRGTGFKGRRALFEILVITREITELINKGASSLQIRELAIAQGMQTLRQQGIKLVEQGITSISEIIRETSL